MLRTRLTRWGRPAAGVAGLGAALLAEIMA